ncbi:MAG: PspA/IM30 family protein, partial [Spirochaetales bacterium]|nr:PspA/IM30 family protein [Spirochaetales bacterium]
MNVFKRMGDIISSNVNSLLDKMEDPEKMIDLSITKLEDAICEMKATIAEKSAERKRLESIVAERRAARDRWQERAKLAAEKNEDQMAKEALEERLRLDLLLKTDEESLSTLTSLLISLRESKEEAEEKLLAMRTKS